MRRALICLSFVFGAGVLATPAKAQTNNSGFSDPFFLYYGFYLPRQAALSAQPQPDDYYRQQSAARQFTAQTQRDSSLFDPLGSTSAFDKEYDPYSAFGPRSAGRGGIARPVPAGIINANLKGNGPSLYYNRTSTYFPGQRTGHPSGVARTSAVARFGGRGGGMGGMGMGGMGMGGMGMGGMR